MNIRIVLASVWLAVGVACGDDSSDNSGDEKKSDAGDTRSEGGASGKSQNRGRGGAGAGAAANAGTTAAATSVECGSTTCQGMGGGAFAGFATPCCADESTSTCGISAMGGACTKPASWTDLLNDSGAATMTS